MWSFFDFIGWLKEFFLSLFTKKEKVFEEYVEPELFHSCNILNLLQRKGDKIRHVYDADLERKLLYHTTNKNIVSSSFFVNMKETTDNRIVFVGKICGREWKLVVCKIPRESLYIPVKERKGFFLEYEHLANLWIEKAGNMDFLVTKDKKFIKRKDQ